MAKNKSNSQGLTPEEVKSELTLLKNSYDMYEKSKEETEFVMKNRLDKNGNRKYSDSRLSDTMKLMQIMQDDIERKYVELGGNVEELKAKKRGRKSGDSLCLSLNRKNTYPVQSKSWKCKNVLGETLKRKLKPNIKTLYVRLTLKPQGFQILSNQ